MNLRPVRYAWPVVPTMVTALICVAITDRPTAHHGPDRTGRRLAARAGRGRSQGGAPLREAAFRGGQRASRLLPPLLIVVELAARGRRRACRLLRRWTAGSAPHVDEVPRTQNLGECLFGVRERCAEQLVRRVSQKR